MFHRRITGEVIIQHPAVLPNAARSDLENNSARQDFLQAVTSFVADLEQWADEIQERSRAEEVLLDVRDKLESLAQELPRIQRDKDAMLQANVRLAECERKLGIHKRTLEGLGRLANELSLTHGLLKSCKTLVADALKTTKQAQKRVEDDVVRVVQSEARSKKEKRPRPTDAPIDLVAALQHSGITLPDDAQRAIRLFETELLVNHVKQAVYVGLLSQLVDLLEEEL